MANKATRPYQNQAHLELYDNWKNDWLSQFLVMATGSGKTFTAVEIVKEFLFEGKRTIWIAHREELISQAFQTMYDHQIYAGVIMGSAKTNYELPVQVCSIQTIARRKDLPPADLIVIDEAHHVSIGSQYVKIVELYPDAKILMLSATPYRLSGHGFQDVFPTRPTKLVLAAPMHYLIDQSWLCPFDYYISSVPDLSDAEITNMGDYEETSARKAMEMAPLVESYFKHAEGKSGIVFAINVAHSMEICGKYAREGVKVEHLDGKTSSTDRANIFKAFKKNELKVLVNCGITTEGTDLPNCEFAQLARPTKSLSLAEQMRGRVSRALPGIVDQYNTISERRIAIAMSSKPYGIILDNAGIAFEHMMPDHKRDWEMHFNGTRGTKRKSKAPTEEQMEMWVYVAEDSTGKQFRSNKMKEIEGMKLIRVDKEARRKIINIKAIKVFDEKYAQFKKMPHVKKPGYVAYENYIEYCNKTETFIPPEVWDYLELRLIKDHEAEYKKVTDHNAAFPGSIPAHMIEKTQKAIVARSVSKRWFTEKRQDYAKANASQMAEYICQKLNLTIQK